jgi:hypothetical protein
MSTEGGGSMFGGGDWFRPSGSYGPWAGCGCSSLLMIIGGFLLIMSGCSRMLGF